MQAGGTLLHWAAIKGNGDAVRWLSRTIFRGNVDQTCNKGRTALQDAVVYYTKEFARVVQAEQEAADGPALPATSAAVAVGVGLSFSPAPLKKKNAAEVREAARRAAAARAEESVSLRAARETVAALLEAGANPFRRNKVRPVYAYLVLIFLFDRFLIIFYHW